MDCRYVPSKQSTISNSKYLGQIEFFIKKTHMGYTDSLNLCRWQHKYNEIPLFDNLWHFFSHSFTLFGTVQCSAVQCSLSTCSLGLCSRVQCMTEPCSSVQVGAVQSSAVQQYCTTTGIHYILKVSFSVKIYKKQNSKKFSD